MFAAFEEMMQGLERARVVISRRHSSRRCHDLSILLYLHRSVINLIRHYSTNLEFTSQSKSRYL